MELISVEALVIGKEDIGESDRIITLFEKERGKIKVLIKGIRKSKNREIYATDPLVLGEYKLRKKGETYINSSFSIKEPYLNIKNSFFKLELSVYLLSFIEKIIFENIASHKLYKMLIKALNYMEKNSSKEEILIMYSFLVYKVLVYEGLRPNFTGSKYFNYSEGSINDINGLELSFEQYKYLEGLNHVDIDAVNKLKFKDKDIFKIIAILESYLNRNLSLELNIIKYFGEEIWI